MPVISFQDLELADKDTEWDSDSADKRVREWANAQDKPNDKYRKAFMWFDNENKDNFTAYKLPYADVIDDKLLAVPSALHSIASVLGGGRGGVDIPQEDKDKVKNQLDKYYKKMELDTEDYKLDQDQQDKFDKVMKEWKDGKLKGTDGKVISDQKQAIAIALSEARKVVNKYAELHNKLIFSVGTFNNIKTKQEDLEDIVKAYKELGGTFVPRLKVTHAEVPYKVGDITNLRIVDDKLYADFVNIPDLVYKLVKEDYLPENNLSCEIIHNFKTSEGKVYPRVLEAVAFTGADTPALWEVMSKETTKYEYKEISKEKIIYKLKENSLMPKEEYENKIKKYVDNGLKTMSYEDFAKMDKQMCSLYFENLDLKMPKKSNNSLENERLELEAIKNEYRLALEQDRLALEKEKNYYKQEVENYKNTQKEKDIDSFLSKLVTEAKLSPSIKEKFSLVLTNLDNSKKVSYKFNDKEESKSVYEMLKDVLESLPVHKEYSLGEVIDRKDGISISSEDLKKYSLNNGEAIDRESIIEHKKIEKYALDNNIDISTEKGYQEVMNKVIEKVGV